METPARELPVAAWLDKRGFDFFCHGHWHNWAVETIFRRPCMKNGSLFGTDNYSEQRGWIQSPRQGWLFVTPGQPVQEFGFIEWEE